MNTEGKAYLDRALELLDTEYPGLWKSEQRLGWKLAAIASLMHPEMVVVGVSAWGNDEFEEKSPFKNYGKSPFDYLLSLPQSVSEERMAKLFFRFVESKKQSK